MSKQPQEVQEGGSGCPVLSLSRIRTYVFYMESCLQKWISEGIYGISGYIIRKLKEKFLNLDLEVSFGETRIGWNFGRSLGNLSIPSLNFLNLVRKWEKYFELYHAKDPSSNFKYKINRNYGVVEELATRICQDFPEVPKTLIKYFVKVRTCIRLKDLNTKLNQWRASKRNARKFGQFAQSSFPGVNFKEESEEDEEDF